MTQVVTVHTDFTDLNQMAQGLVGRVNETHVILPGPDPVDVGEWVQFAVTLFDGTPGFAGVGRCVTVVDNGEERLAHQRFDVVIDSLQFDPRGQQVFEHILSLNGLGGGTEGAEPEADDAAYVGDGEASYAEEDAGFSDDAAARSEDTGSFEDVSYEFTASKLELAIESAAQDQHDSGATMVADSATLDAALAQQLADEEPEDDESQPTVPPVVTPQAPYPRASFGEPLTGAPPAVAAKPQSNGATTFAYANGLPFPAQPPRPQLDPAQRVTPAPRPEAD